MTISDFSIGTDASAAAGGTRRGTTDPDLIAWVNEIAALTKPDEIVWCDGSKQEADLLTKQMLAEGKLKYREDIVEGGIAKAPEAFAGLLRGENFGKLQVRIGPEPAGLPKT